jgi:EAL domain-containing protein (putative c-di-GMP-specific phosphodiesterase class I)
VEDEQTVAAIEELGCESAQGYLFCRPLPPADLSAWIASRHRTTPAQVAI